MRNDDKRTSDIGASDARPPDDGLILRIAEGDTAALEVLYRQTSASVYGFALSILRDPTAAEDVIQDTFVSVMQSASSYQPSGKPMAVSYTHLDVYKRQAGGGARDDGHRTR